MDSTTFEPMYDLERLSENERATYYRSACAFLGIPANLNLLAFINMVVGDSGRHLVLYAKKGATDLIRQNRGISTVALDAIKDLVPGQVCFLAVGRDKDGREERAIGSADIAELRGKDLSDAVMIAQTRATRRMTLQFVGGGILDESELPSNQTSLTNATPALDAIITQPVVEPNQTPSIVERPIIDPKIIEAANALTAGIIASTNKAIEAELAKPTPAQREAEEALSKVNPDVLATASGDKTVKTVAELLATLPSSNPLVQAATSEPQKQRRRKSANEVTLNTPAQEAQPPAIAAPMIPTTAPVSAVIPAQTPQQNLVPAAPVLPAQPVQPVAAKDPLTPEQKKEITERLAKYRNEILPGKIENGYGGMDNVEGLGGVEIQLRKFVVKFNPDKPSSKTWDYEDWNKFIGFFDDTVKAIGARGLVRYIQQAIGLLPFPDDQSAPRLR